MIEYDKKSTEGNEVKDVVKKGSKFLGQITGKMLKQQVDQLGDSIVEDTTANAKDFVYNVINSALFKTYKTASNALQAVIYGEIKASRNKTMYDRPSYLANDYNAVSSKTTTVVNSNNSVQVTKVLPAPRPKSAFDFDKIIFPDRETADSYLERMKEYICIYGAISVQQFYTMVGRNDPGNYTLREYAWSTLEKAAVERIADGQYILDLPEPKKS